MFGSRAGQLGIRLLIEDAVAFIEWKLKFERSEATCRYRSPTSMTQLCRL